MLTSTVCQPPMPADVIANALLGKGIGNILFPRTVGFPHCSKANSYVFQGWTIQMRQAKSYLAFRCEIPKYIIHVILFAKGCISSTHYSCSYRSIISCCKWYRKYAYCYISRQTCRISPLFTRPQGRYKVCRRNSYSNNQKRLLLLSNLRDDNGRYFQWCCCEHYLQRHNTL